MKQQIGEVALEKDLNMSKKRKSKERKRISSNRSTKQLYKDKLCLSKL